MKLFDTTFLIDLVSGDEGAARKAEKVDAEVVFKAISAITVHESCEESITYTCTTNPC